MTRLYIRTCQECDNRQISKPITEYKSDTWQDIKCKRCKSIALDYGSYMEVDPISLKSIPSTEDEEFGGES